MFRRLVSGLLACAVALGPSVVLTGPASAVSTPGPAEKATTFPTQGGLGVAWKPGSPSAEEYRVERRADGESAWTEVATVPRTDQWQLSWVDPGTAPGASASYRLTGLTGDTVGESVEISGTRAATVPEPGPQSLMAMDTNKREPVVISSSDPGETLVGEVSDSGSPSITITSDSAPFGTGTFYVPAVPGPGSYQGKGGSFLSTYSTRTDRYGCSADQWFLEVRSVAYDADLVPVVLDASYTGVCDWKNVVERVEIRLGVDRGYAIPEADPVDLGRLKTHHDIPVSRTITFTGSGTEPVHLGAARIAARPGIIDLSPYDWEVTDNACEGATLGAGDSCEVEVTFSTFRTGRRLAQLVLDARDDSGAVTPYVILLDGWGGTAPGDPTPAGTHRPLRAIRVVWAPERNDQYPITYEIWRSDDDVSATPRLIGKVGYMGRSYYDDDVELDGHYTYRVRAVNEVGSSPLVLAGPERVSPGTRAVLATAEIARDEPRMIIEMYRGYEHGGRILGSDRTHDHRAPAVSPGGTVVASSRSTSPGLGEDGEYDIWAGTVDEPDGRRLTDLPGTELDAAFSPDSSLVAFTHVAPEGARSVWVVPTEGGAPRKLRDGVASPVWSLDGSHLVVEDDSAVDAPLLRLDIDGGGTEPVPGTEGGSDPALSRTGNLAFVTGDGLVELDHATSTTEVHYEGYAGLSDPAYDVDGQLMVTSSDQSGNSWVLLLEGRTSRFASLGDRDDFAEAAPIQLDVTDPVIAVDGLADYVRGDLEATVGATDGTETPEVALHPECRLDSAAWQNCAGAVSFTGLGGGQHALDLRVTDEAGHTATRSETFVSDLDRPSVRLPRPRGLAQLGRWVRTRWEGSDRTSPVDDYETRIRRASATRRFGPYRRIKGWPAWTSRTRASLPLSPGSEICIRVRTRDAAGNRSGFRRRCIARPIDDSDLAASRGWRRVTTRGGWQHTLTVTRHARARLVYRGVTTRRIGVLATTCRGCGSVRVYVGRRYVGEVSLRSRRVRHRVMRHLPRLPRLMSGRITLRTTSARPVRIDGLLLRRT